MLGKLIKYDFKGVARYMLPLYTLVLVTTIGMKFILEIPIAGKVMDSLRAFFIFSYVISIIAISTGGVIILLMRFYKNLMTDEGYLSLTLPVSSTAHLSSKLLNGFIWIIATILVLILSVLLLLTSHIYASDWKLLSENLSKLFNEITRVSGISKEGLFVYIGLYILLYSFSMQIKMYFCICAGQLFTGHRILGAFVSYFVLAIVSQFLYIIPVISNIDELIHVSSYSPAIQRLLNSSFLLEFFTMIVLFFASRYLITKKLNLE